MRQENKEKRQIPFITIVVISLIIIAIIVAFVVTSSIFAYYDNMHEQGEILSTNYSMQYSKSIDNYVDQKIEALKEIDRKSEDNSGDINATLVDFEKNENVEKLFWHYYYVKDNKIFDSTGTQQETNEQILEFCKNKQSGITGVFSAYPVEQYVAVCVPFENRENYQMLVGYIWLTNFVENNTIFFNSLIDLPNFYIMPICNRDGSIVGQFVTEKDIVTDDWGFAKKIGSHTDRVDDGHKISNIFNSIYLFSGGKTNKEVVQNELDKLGYYSLFFSMYSKEYVLTLFSPSNSNGNLLYCQVFEADTILSGQNNFIAIILVSIVILAIIVIGLIVLGVKYRKAWIKKLEFQENYEPLTGANTYKMFKDKFKLISGYNKYSKYAVIYIELKQFDILYENYGENTTNEVIVFCSKVIGKTIDKTETYGHISNGKFILAIHYKDLKDLEHRMSVIYALINNYNKFEKVEFTLSFSAGVYLLNRGEKTNADICLNNAIIAEKSVNLTREKYYCIYDEKLDEARQREREIELRKEQAINNKEFQVYYQPKLNLALDTVDGAEALVRWYYPEQDKIYSPSMFLPIFELNGFVEKLDRYVYLEVLSFMKKMVDSGKKVCPISVNVSRFTALQPDFVSFYTENKKKYGIADNYICIEFTESFAFDNNQKLFEIVKELKKNGLICSIDDFGVGYSSYSILKDLPMDEIKLDAFFMRHGYDVTRDEKTLKSIIKLGKDLGLKVTQEGVESMEELKKLKEYGCDVLQGYIYSKPLSQSLFEEFLFNKIGVYGKQK